MLYGGSKITALHFKGPDGSVLDVAQSDPTPVIAAAGRAVNQGILNAGTAGLIVPKL